MERNSKMNAYLPFLVVSACLLLPFILSFIGMRWGVVLALSFVGFLLLGFSWWVKRCRARGRPVFQQQPNSDKFCFYLGMILLGLSVEVAIIYLKFLGIS